MNKLDLKIKHSTTNPPSITKTIEHLMRSITEDLKISDGQMLNLNSMLGKYKRELLTNSNYYDDEFIRFLYQTLNSKISNENEKFIIILTRIFGDIEITLKASNKNDMPISFRPRVLINQLNHLELVEDILIEIEKHKDKFSMHRPYNLYLILDIISTVYAFDRSRIKYSLIKEQFGNMGGFDAFITLLNTLVDTIRFHHVEG